MPRVYIRKTDKGQVPREVMERAIQAVKEGMPVRKAAKTYSIAHTTLNNNLVKAKKDSTAKLEPNYKHSHIFNQEQETSIANYLEKCSGMFHGLTTKNVRTLAYEMAFLNRIEMPATWTEKQIAAREWLFGFLRRHETLAIRQPEATSLARATAFNRATVGAFFDILHDCLEKIGASGDRIFNLDETGVTTVQKVPKVVATKGLKQVGQITSRERGELVTVCVIVSASGQTLPPAFVFLRKNFKEFMMHGSPEGSLGLVDSSGWMTAANFIKVMNHLITNARPSQDHQVVLIMDNHQSHLSYKALSLAKENFVHIITLPPHTSNKTQPLDRTVFGPMKTHYNQLANSWMMRNVGKLITIYQIAELAGTALTKATTPENVIVGFRVSGVWPFDRYIFSNVDYLPSDITDRPAPEDNHADNIAPTVGPSRSLSISGEDNHAVDIAPTVAQPSSLSISREHNHAVDIAPTVGPSRSLSISGEDNHAVDIAPTVGPSRSLSISGEDNHAVDIAPTVAQPSSLSISREHNHAVDIAPTVGPSRSLSNSGEDNHAVDIAPTVAQPRSLSISREDNHAVDISPTVPQPRALSSLAGSIDTSLTAKASTSFSTPDTFRGYPKAGPRHQPKAGKGTMVATSTPEMAIIKKQHMVKMNAKQGSSKAVTNKTAKAKATAKTHTVKRTIIIEPGAEDSDNADHTFCNELSDGEDGGKPPIVLGNVTGELLHKYTVCEFCTSDSAKKHIKYMVGFVREDEDEDGDIGMSFLRRSHKVANKFIMPNTADIGMVKIVQVKVILPDPIGTVTTHRTKCGIVFNVAFGNLKLY